MPSLYDYYSDCLDVIDRMVVAYHYLVANV